MSLVINEQTPFFESLRGALKRYPTNESGIIVKTTLQTPVIVSSSAELLSTVVAEDIGVLIISARPHLWRGAMIRTLLDTKSFSNIACFGVHHITVEDRIVLQRGIQVYSMQEIMVEGLSEVTDAVMSYVRGWKRFIIFLDMDVLDLAFVPGIKRGISAGMSSRELIYVISRLKRIKTFAGAYIFADFDGSDTRSVDVVAKLLSELLVD